MKLRALRNMDYGTRRLKAGDEFDPLQSEHTRFLTQTGFAEEIAVKEESVASSRRRRRLRPTPQAKSIMAEPEPKPEPTPEPEPEPQVEEKSLEDHTRAELLEMAEEKQVELPTGYVRKEDLVEILSPTITEDE